jgi:hypothetical protein
LFVCLFFCSGFFRNSNKSLFFSLDLLFIFYAVRVPWPQNL